MAAPRRLSILKSLLALGVAVLAIGSGVLVFMRTRPTDDRAAVLQRLQTKYGAAEAGRRIAVYDAQMTGKSATGQEIFWHRTLSELILPPKERHTMLMAQTEQLERK